MAFQNIDHYKEKAKYSEKMYMAMGEPSEYRIENMRMQGAIAKFTVNLKRFLKLGIQCKRIKRITAY